MELTYAQKSAINHIDGHLQIIACAGSGKTEVISRRIANILRKKTNVKPENIVAFTFTEKAANSLKSRIESALGTAVPGMYIGTIHGFCAKLLKEYAEDFADFKVLDEVKNHHFLNRYAAHCGMHTLKLFPNYRNNRLFLQFVDKLIDDYDNRFVWTEDQTNALEQYRNCLYEHKFIDFSLLIFEALQQIKGSLSVQEYCKSIKYLVVDEYQDVNDLQEKLIRAIADHGANICVVGDDDQTIYQFRGSNADNMISFPRRYPDVWQIRLEENFRCTPKIVDVAANVIGHNENRLQKQMTSGTTIVSSVVQARGYWDFNAEFSAIVEKISQLHCEGLPYKDIAVLVRKGKYIPQIAKNLALRDIPYTADSAEEFFGGIYFPRFLETLRMLDSIDKAALYEQWKDVAEDTSFLMGFKYLRGCARGGNYRLSEILCEFCERIHFLNENAADITVRSENLKGFCQILDDYDAIYGDCQLSYRISKLLRFLVEQANQAYKYHNFREIEPNDDAVQLMTVHKSKGLEFHTVFVPRLNKRDFPVSKMGGRQYYHILGGTFEENKEKYESDIEDERKLFYVAVTRAKQNLFLSYTLDKQPISEFVSNAAESVYLNVDRTELTEYTEKVIDWDLVREAREALFDYYCVANHFCKGIMGEYLDICRRGPEAILETARSYGLI